MLRVTRVAVHTSALEGVCAQGGLNFECRISGVWPQVGGVWSRVRVRVRVGVGVE